MGYVWIVFWGACGVLAILAGVRIFARVRRHPDRMAVTVDDDAIGRIIDDGVIESKEDEPLDLNEIEAEERLFWEQSWEEAEEW